MSDNNANTHEQSLTICQFNFFFFSHNSSCCIIFCCCCYCCQVSLIFTFFFYFHKESCFLIIQRNLCDNYEFGLSIKIGSSSWLILLSQYQLCREFHFILFCLYIQHFVFTINIFNCKLNTMKNDSILIYKYVKVSAVFESM